jgi:trimeric autotransporter adhesin
METDAPSTAWYNQQGAQQSSKSSSSAMIIEPNIPTLITTSPPNSSPSASSGSSSSSSSSNSSSVHVTPSSLSSSSTSSSSSSAAAAAAVAAAAAATISAHRSLTDKAQIAQIVAAGQRQSPLNARHSSNQAEFLISELKGSSGSSSSNSQLANALKETSQKNFLSQSSSLNLANSTIGGGQSSNIVIIDNSMAGNDQLHHNISHHHHHLDEHIPENANIQLSLFSQSQGLNANLLKTANSLHYLSSPNNGQQGSASFYQLATQSPAHFNASGSVSDNQLINNHHLVSVQAMGNHPQAYQLMPTQYISGSGAAGYDDVDSDADEYEESDEGECDNQNLSQIGIKPS